METITAGGRRTLPPVPRSAGDRETARDTRPPVPGRTPSRATSGDDPGQLFVAALRAAAPGFAAAAGAATAVVAEAVPPARHRRARCRLVLLAADGTEAGRVFAGAPGRPGTDAAVAFTEGITRWLAALDQAGGCAADAPGPDAVVELPG